MLGSSIIVKIFLKLSNYVINQRIKPAGIWTLGKYEYVEKMFNPKSTYIFFCKYGGLNRLFSHISSDENTLDQRNNGQSTNQQPNKSEDQRKKDSTKHQVSLCPTCKRNFKTARDLTQHQKRCKTIENTNENNITVHSITVQPSIVINVFFKAWENFSIMDLQQVVSSIYDEVIKWSRNLFMLLSGKAGKKYIDECTHLILVSK